MPYIRGLSTHETEPLLALEIGNIFHFKVQEEAISNAMADIELCRKMTRQCGNEDKDIMVQLLAAQNHYTLVAYPVSYHYDVFRKGEHSLENKICFEFDLDENHVDNGRGGKGNGVFVFALLDWTNSRSTESRRLQYQITSGKLTQNERLTKEKWNKQFGTM